MDKLIISELKNNLEQIVLDKEENWAFKKKSYSNVIKILESNTIEINSIDDILKILRNGGSKFAGEETHFKKNGEYKSAIIKKIYYTITKKNGGISELQEKYNSIKELTSVAEIGSSAANKLYDLGINNIEELRLAFEKDSSILNRKQIIGLKYHEDLQHRIPRSEMDDWNLLLKKEFQDLCEEKNMVGQICLVGSYRREKIDSGDVDCLITTEEHNPDFLTYFLEKLFATKKLKKKLSFSQGKTKYMGLGKIDKYYRHVDIFYYKKDEYPFALYFSTGSGDFNVAVRAHALKMGYSLSDHGLINKKNKKKVDQIFNDEESIFKFLNIEYVEPKFRTYTALKIKN